MFTQEKKRKKSIKASRCSSPTTHPTPLFPGKKAKRITFISLPAISYQQSGGIQPTPQGGGQMIVNVNQRFMYTTATTRLASN